MRYPACGCECSDVVGDAVRALGDLSLGPGETAQRKSEVLCRGHRSRQRTAAFGGRRRQFGRPAPAFGAMVFRNDPDRTVRRGPDGRRRFRVARRRDQFRQRPRAGRDRAARGDFEHRRPAERSAQDRPPAGAQRAERRAANPARSDLDARARSRIGARAFLRARHRQSFADRQRSLRQHSPVQSAKAPHRFRRRRRPDAGRGTGRRSFVRDLRFGAGRQTAQGDAGGDAGGLRSQFAAAEGQDGDAVAARRRAHAGARRRRQHRDQHQRRRQCRRHAEFQIGLRRRKRSQHLFRLRAARRARERHAVAEDDDPDQRRRRLERAPSRRSRTARRSARSCASSAPRPRRSRASLP